MSPSVLHIQIDKSPFFFIHKAHKHITPKKKAEEEKKNNICLPHTITMALDLLQTELV